MMRVDFDNGRIKGIISGTETKNQGGRNAGTEETVEFRYLFSLPPTVFVWRTRL